MNSCTACGADWDAGEFTEDCSQCGGGALHHACVVCGGRCGRSWERAVMDSQDADMAHWIGGCGLPPAEQLALIRGSAGNGQSDP